MPCAAPPFTHQPPLVAPPAGSQQPHTKSRDQEVQGGASILKPTPRLNHRLPQGSRATKLTPLSKVPCVVELPPPSSSKLTFKESSSHGIFPQLRNKSWVGLKSAKWEVRRISSPQEKVVDARGTEEKKMEKRRHCLHKSKASIRAWSHFPPASNANDIG